MQISTIGVDLAKNVFQVHGVDSAGKVVITRQLRRKQVLDFFRVSFWGSVNPSPLGDGMQ